MDPKEFILPLASTSSILKDLRNICIGVYMKRSILVSGRIGSGKTHLIRYLAQQVSQESCVPDRIHRLSCNNP